MAEAKHFVWIGSAGQVVKPGVRQLFVRGVPAEVPALMEDFFENDPQFIEVKATEAKKIHKDIKDAKDLKAELKVKAKVVKSLKVKAEAKMTAWYKKRDKHRAKTSVKEATKKMKEKKKPQEG